MGKRLFEVGLHIDQHGFGGIHHGTGCIAGGLGRAMGIPGVRSAGRGTVWQKIGEVLQKPELIAHEVQRHTSAAQELARLAEQQRVLEQAARETARSVPCARP
jgi:hypothetical protein